MFNWVFVQLYAAVVMGRLWWGFGGFALGLAVGVYLSVTATMRAFGRGLGL